MDPRHARCTAVVADAMAGASATMLAPGASWAIASGPAGNRHVTLGATGGAGADAIFQISSVTKVIATACTLGLVADGVLGLDDPIERWVPAWRDRRVLRWRHGPIDDTVAPRRPVTVRDLLRMGFGLGYDVSPGGDDALTRASAEAGVMSSWVTPRIDSGAWVERTADLPMRHQPGEGWLYQTSFDALTVVLEAAAGHRFELLLRERILDPLGMSDTGYHVAEDQLHRVPALYFPNDHGGADLVRLAADPGYRSSPVFPSASTGLFSTAADLIKFGQSVLDGALGPQTPTLEGAASAMASEFLEPGMRWGLGVGIDEYGWIGWDGGTGASFRAEPATGIAAVLLTHQGSGSTTPVHVRSFWNGVRGY